MKGPAPHPGHGAEELCPTGRELYERALREGRISAADAADVPCLVDFGLLKPSLSNPALLEPVPPAVVLPRLLRSAEERIAGERRRVELLAEAFEPLMRIDGRRTESTADVPALQLLSGTDRINRAITEAVDGASHEVLCVQPHTSRVREHGEEAHRIARRRDQALLDRGGRIRTLYQHTRRNAPDILAYQELLNGDTQVRTLHEVTDRLIVVDGSVAFLPANDDGTLALEARHPALLQYFTTTFDRLWRLATPLYPQAVQPPAVNGFPSRQRAIAALLVEGHTDAAIADRLGMNIRTARLHIAKLAATLGSDSRAQLGYLIARSGILDQQA
ncbi:helix-turn-helix transcriptional regulator [Streptomyces sp. FXJ1.172]|uniref:helix-turn-helix transcriptional regulator n=1 Tax=Streptomyces sp. FXJ1.172 TaxID=710705 RepID=UPI0007CEFE9C|nr:LuxR family transcriptional regulator [Streptomyces sp. FXJ1.172]WEO96290.1 helix-turn-helix transcriptional regulator [Streptomyces sp. FXJ1.172]